MRCTVWILAGLFFCTAMVQAAKAETKAEWARIGSPDQVKIISSGEISLSVGTAATAGAVSASRAWPRGADAVLVRAHVRGAGARALTVSTHDGAGDTVGYWQNIVGWDGPVDMAAVLPIATVSEQGSAPQSVRLFVGTDGRASKAKVEELKWEFVDRGEGSAGAIYAREVDVAHQCGQSFVAKGQLAAIVLRMRYSSDKPGFGLRLTVHEWKGSIAATRQSRPIGEGLLEAERIPAGVEGNQRDIAIALDAPTQAGRRYLIEIAPEGQVADGQSVLLWSGPEDGKGGECFENGQPIQQDLFFQTYYDAH